MNVRVYLPLTRSELATAVAARRVATPTTAHAVTDELRAAWPDGDEEQWEYAALMAAAADARPLATAAGERRRTVLAADVDAVMPDPHSGPTGVRLTGPVPWTRVAAVHVDVADDADDDEDLAWFATQEIPGLLDS